MIGIVDYQVGNVGNLIRALTYLKRETAVLKYPYQVTEKTEILILPGVGAFPAAMKALKGRGWVDFLREWSSEGKALLGICLGMQVLMENSFEDGHTEGLGIIEGDVEPLVLRKYPHIGWNTLRQKDSMKGTNPLFTALSEDADYYFVHGYALKCSDFALTCTEVENEIFVSSILKGRSMGFQFHPERSSMKGLRLLDSALEYLEGKSS